MVFVVVKHLIFFPTLCFGLDAPLSIEHTVLCGLNNVVTMFDVVSLHPFDLSHS